MSSPSSFDPSSPASPSLPSKRRRRHMSPATKKYDWKGGATEKTKITVNKIGAESEQIDDDIAAWKESGYIDYMSNQREKGWKT